jgi:hypothetical protein
MKSSKRSDALESGFVIDNLETKDRHLPGRNIEHGEQELSNLLLTMWRRLDIQDIEEV